MREDGGEDIGVCGIGQLFIRYPFDFYLKLCYLPNLRDAFLEFWGTKVNTETYPSHFPDSFRISDRIGNKLKLLHFIAYVKKRNMIVNDCESEI